MIPRTLVPVDVRPMKDGEKKEPPRRLETYMDDRTVVPSGLSNAPPLDGKTTIPAHFPLGVLVNRTLVPRGMPAKTLERRGEDDAPASIAVMDERTVVPAYVEPLTAENIREFEHPRPMTADLREVVEPDIFTTGDANLLIDPEKKRDAKWDAVTRVLSVVVHIAVIIFLISIPKLFPPHVPTQEELDFAKKEMPFVYVPSEVSEPPAPTPKIHVAPNTLKRVAPPIEKPAIEAPQPVERPAAELPDAPKPRTPVTPPPSEPDAPKPSRLEPVLPATPSPNHPNLQLPQSSPGKMLDDQLSDAIQHRGGQNYSGDDRVPARPGGQGGAPPAMGNSVTMLTPTEGVDFDSYLKRWHDSTERVLDSILPESFYMGSKGVCVIQFHIMRDGSVPPGEPILIRSSGKEPLDRTALASIRGASPYEPLPAAFKGPSIELQAVYYFNVGLPQQ
jgi:outer membrane biosynthesis protein TonB